MVRETTPSVAISRVERDHTEVRIAFRHRARRGAAVGNTRRVTEG